MEGIAKCFGSGDDVWAGLRDRWVRESVGFCDIQGCDVVVSHVVTCACETSRYT